jgi:nitroreductase
VRGAVIMSLRSTIRNRVSTKKYTTEWVNPDKIISLLDTAVYAPNHKMREPWRFIIIEGEGKDKLVNNYVNMFKESEREDQRKLLSKVMEAPAIVSVIMKKSPVLADEVEDLQACAALIQNFLLLLEEERMASHWKTPKYIESEKFKDALGIQNNEVIVALIMVGYPLAKTEPKTRQSAKSLTTIY